MCALYCEPKWRDFGIPDAGWRGHGGLLSHPETGDIIPQHNLAAAWRRPVAPVVTGYVEGLLPPSQVERGLLRPPGHFRFDLSLETLRNRNLLAASKDDETRDIFHLWLISERSDRKTLKEYGVPPGKSTSSGDWFLDPMDVTSSAASHSFDEAVCQIHPSQLSGMAVWARSRQNLQLLADGLKEATSIFKGSVSCFEESSLLPGDVTLVDVGGMVWSGTIGQSLSRTKNNCGDRIRLLTQSDHPRLQFAASDFQVRLLDLREDSLGTRKELFTMPEYDQKCSADNVLYLPTVSMDRSPILHISSIPDHLHHCLVVSGHHAYLLDSRMPGLPVLSQPHVIPEGGSVLISPPRPQKDPLADGDIVSSYALDQGGSGIWVSRLYAHDCNLWSSIEPIHRIADPDESNHIIAPFRPDDVIVSAEPARGVAVLQGMKDEKGRPIDVLLRSLDDGTVMYQTMRYGAVTAEEEKMLWESSLKRVRRWNRQRAKEETPFVRIMPEAIRSEPTAACTLVDVEVSHDVIGSLRRLPSQVNPFRRRIHSGAVVLRKLRPSHEEALLSKTVLDMWRGTAETVLNGGHPTT